MPAGWRPTLRRDLLRLPVPLDDHALALELRQQLTPVRLRAAGAGREGERCGRHQDGAAGRTQVRFNSILIRFHSNQFVIFVTSLPRTAVVNAMDDGDCTPSYCAVHVRDKQLIDTF